MGIKFQLNHDKLVCIYVPEYNNDVILEKINKDGCSIKNTFFVKKKDLTTSIEDPYEEAICFIIGEKDGEYIKIDRSILNLRNNFYFLDTIHFEQKLFIAQKNISILKKIDALIEFDFYVGLENKHEHEISYELYIELVKNFPNSKELYHYTNSRISTILKEALPQIDKYEMIYNKYLSKNKQLSFVNERKEPSNNLRIELEQFTTALNDLKNILNDTEHNERYWQEKICQILHLLYPKYILYKREMKFQGIDDYDKQPDFVLVDANGFIDILEIKKPTIQILTRQASYRNNYVPMRSLSGSIQQIEKYLYCLNRLNPNSDPFFTVLKASLPKNINPVALNPQGILLLGRSNQFNKQQKNDFELIKRQYKHLTDIMTYDDLISRLENIISALELKLS